MTAGDCGFNRSLADNKKEIVRKGEYAEATAC